MERLRALLKKLLIHKPGEESGGMRLSVSWAVLIGVCLVLACAVGWAFFMGLMVGQGQNPQTSIQTMTGLGRTEAQETAQAPEVLPEPELAQPVIKPAVEPREPERPAPARPNPQPKPAQKAPQKQEQAQQYDYTFQAAAFRTEADAKKLNSTINKNGMRSTVRRSGKVYLVVVSLRGDAGDVANLRKKLQSLKIGNPMQLSRKPVEARKGRKK